MQSAAPNGGTAPSPFPTTRWSVVLAAGDQASASGRRALAELCQAYWRPLYTYVRRRGFAEHEAQDLTQDFFLFLLDRDVFARADRERGRFRTFLLASFRNFLADEHDRRNARKRGGAVSHFSWDALIGAGQGSEQLDFMAAASPETCFDTSWALTLAQRALAVVRDDYSGHNRGRLFDSLRAFLVGGPTDSYACIAGQLGMSEAAVTSAVHRLRQEYRATLRHLVAQTVRDVADIEDELRYLKNILAQRIV